jgi:16S rRNA (uracil1498-N3)-methyltransferase
MHRFFVPPESIQTDRVVFPRPAAEQLRNVLRIAPGEHVVVLTGDGWECEVEVTYVGKGNAAGRVLGRRQNGREPHIALTLYQCLLKKDHFEWVLQKCTEVGVMRFVPVVSERTIVRGVELIGGAKQERWARIIVEAAEQSGRGRVPTLVEAMSLQDALADCAAQDFKAIAWEEEPVVRLQSLLDDWPAGQAPASVGLFVGPEGGFSADEIDAARQHGIQPVTLGARTLRSETASVVMASLALHLFGELG